MNFYERVAAVQAALKAPKGQHNKFGGYSYRSCEDILEAVKPLLNGLVLVISDDIVPVGNRIYVKATATITDGENSLVNTAFAREAETKKGMDDSQITGSTSSYARKYALNGLLLIDDTKDADATNDHGKGPQRQAQQRPTVKPDPALIEKINTAPSLDALAVLWGEIPAEQRQALAKCKDGRKKQLQEAA